MPIRSQNAAGNGLDTTLSALWIKASAAANELVGVVPFTCRVVSMEIICTVDFATTNPDITLKRMKVDGAIENISDTLDAAALDVGDRSNFSPSPTSVPVKLNQGDLILFDQSVASGAGEYVIAVRIRPEGPASIA